MPGRKYTPKGASASNKTLYTAYISNGAMKQIQKEVFGDDYKKRVRMVPSVVYKRLMDEAPLMAPGVDEKTMISLLKKGFPGYQEPTAEEIEERKKLSEELQKRFYDVKLKKDIVYYATYPENPKMAYQREFNIINDGDLSMEGIQRNQEFYRKYVNGTVEEQKEANIELLKRLGKIDLSKIDLLDPKSLADNMDALSDIMFIGAEMQPVVARAKELGIDFNDPELADFCEKAEAIYEYGMAARLTIDMYSTPMYQYIGKLDNPLLKDFGGTHNDIPDGSMTYETLFGDIGSDLYEKDRSLPSYFDQLGVLRLLNAPYGDHTISPEERLKKYLSKGHDMFGLRNVEGPAPDLDDETAPFFEPKDAEIKKVYNKFIGCNPASLYSASDQKFNPALMSDMERLCILKDGNLVPAFEIKGMPYPFGHTEDFPDELMDNILTSGDLYFVDPADNKPYQIKDGKLAAKPSELKIPGELTLSEEDERLHKIEVELYDTAKVKNARKKLYGKDFNEFGAEQYKDYYENIAFNANKVNSDLAYPGSSDQNNALSDEDYEAITMFCYADPNVNGKHYYNGKGNPDAIAFAALGMGPNDLYCMRANKDKDENLNIFVDSRLAAKDLIEQHNKKNDGPIAEAIARSISIVGTSGVSVVSLTATGHNGLHSASSAYRFLKDHPDIYELARKKAEDMGNDALARFDKGYKDCHRADNMLKIAEDGLKAEYRLALYKARKMKNADGKVYTITKEEKKELERKVLLKKGLEASMKNQEKLHDNNVAAITKFAEIQSKMNDIPQEEKANYIEIITDDFNYDRLATSEYDPMIEALDQDVIEYVGIYAKTPEDAAVLTEYFNLKEKIESRDPSVQKTPEFIAKMAKTRYAAEKLLLIDPDDKTAQSRTYTKNVRQMESFFLGLSDEAFIENCKTFVTTDDFKTYFNAVNKAGEAVDTAAKKLSPYGTQGEAYIKGLFAPKISPEGAEGMRMDFGSSTEEFKKYQKDASDVVLYAAKGLTEDDVTMAAMGLFLDPANMERNYEEARIQPGSTLPKLKDGAMAATVSTENFLIGMLSKDDERANIHLSRSMVPAARKQCREVLMEYENGNKKPFVDAIQSNFKTCLAYIKLTKEKASSALCRVCAENMEKCLNILGREEFKGITDISEEDLAASKAFIDRTKFYYQNSLLEKEIVKYQAEHLSDTDKHFLDDPEFAEKIARYSACKYIERVMNIQLVAKSANTLGLINNTGSLNEMKNRDLLPFEKMASEDMESLVKAVEESVIKKSPEYIALKDKSFKQVLIDKSMETVGEIDVDIASCNIEENLDYLLKGIQQYYTSPELKDPKYEGIKANLLNFEKLAAAIRSNPDYTIDDLEELAPIAATISQEAGGLIKDLTDTNDLMSRLHYEMKPICVKAINATKKMRLVNDTIAKEYQKVKGVEAAEEIPAEELKEPQAPKEQSPEEVWFDSFVEDLGKLGISFDNPLSLGFVREINIEFDHDRDVMQALEGEKANDPEAVDIVLAQTHKAFPMAFANGKIRDRMYQGSDYAQFLKKNMRDPKDFSPEEKKRLYELAKDNRLMIQDPKKAHDFRLARLGDNNKALITVPLIEHDPTATLKVLDDPNTPQADKDALRKQWKDKTSFYPEEINAGIKKASEFGRVLQAQQVISGDFVDKIERKYDKHDDKGQFIPLTEDQEKALSQEKEAFLGKLRWELNGNLLMTTAYSHPDWVNTPEGLKLQNDIVKALSTPEDLRTKAEKALVENNCMMQPCNLEIEDKICKLFKVDSLVKVPFGMIKDSEGKPFGDKYSYDVINKIGKHNLEGKTFTIGDIKMIYSDNNGKFLAEAPLNLYQKEVSDLLKELKATDSIFSQDTDSYTNLKTGLETLNTQLQSLIRTGVEVPDDRTFHTLFGKIKAAADLGTKYQEAHAGIEDLSTRQKDRLAVIAKLQNLCDKADPKTHDCKPDDPVNKLAEKIAIETSIDLQNSKSKVNKLYGRSIEMSHHNMKIFAKDISGSDAFKALVQGQSKDALNALLGQKPGVALKALKRQEEILRKQAEAAEKTAAKQEVKEVKEVKADKGPVAK